MEQYDFSRTACEPLDAREEAELRHSLADTDLQPPRVRTQIFRRSDREPSVTRLESLTVGQINSAMHSLAEKFQISSSISQPKGDEISALIQTMRARMNNRASRLDDYTEHMKSVRYERNSSSNSVVSANPHEEGDAGCKTQAPVWDDDVTASIRRLAQLAYHDAHELRDDDADSVIKDLGCVVSTILTPQTQFIPSQKCKCSADATNDTTAGHVLKRFCASIAASTRMSINSGGEDTLRLSFVSSLDLHWGKDRV